MGPSRRCSPTELGRKVPRRHHMLPISCVEIPAGILPSPVSTLGFIIAENCYPEVTPGGPAWHSCDAAMPAAPLRVLLLPPACTLPGETCPEKAQDAVRRLLLQTGRGERSTAGSAITEPRDSLVQAVFLALARQARLARELLATGYQVVGTWMRIDEGEASFEECMNQALQQHQIHKQHSFFSFICNAMIEADAIIPQLALVSEQSPSHICCCFLLFSSDPPRRRDATTEGHAVRVGAYHCSGPSAISLEVRRLPVVIRGVDHSQPSLPSLRSLVYCTFLPLQIEVSFVPSERFSNYAQTSGQQLSAAVASQLHANFAAVLTPPLLASYVPINVLPAPSESCIIAGPSTAPQACGERVHSSVFKTRVCTRLVTISDGKTQVRGTRTTARRVAKKLRRSAADSACPAPLRRSSTPSSELQQQPSSKSYAGNLEESADYCRSLVLSAFSEKPWDLLHGQGTYSCRSPVCVLQPFVVGDVVLRYMILLDVLREPLDHLRETSPVQFRVVPCDDVCDAAPHDSCTSGRPKVSVSEISCGQAPVTVCVTGEIVAAAVARLDASVEYLRRSLAADAAGAVARRIAERLADTCMAYCQKRRRCQARRQNIASVQLQEMPSLLRCVTPLDVRRFYMVNPGRVSRYQIPKETDDAVCALLLNDCSIPQETEYAATREAADRFEFLLGIPSASVVPHSFLRDGGAAAVIRITRVRSRRLRPREMNGQHELPMSAIHTLQENAAQPCFEVRCPPDVGFWNDVEIRTTEGIAEETVHACRKKTSAFKAVEINNFWLWASLVLFVVVLAWNMLYPSAARITEGVRF